MTTDCCPACRVARELTEHLVAHVIPWGNRRAAFNFARVLARQACPEYVPTTEERP